MKNKMVKMEVRLNNNMLEKKRHTKMKMVK